MTCYNLPAQIRGIIFDMDSTLYTNEAYQRFQCDAIIERLAAVKNLSFDVMNAQVEAYRNDWEKTHGSKTSLGNAFTAFGISIAESARWREELYHPEDYLSEDVQLQKTIKLLKQDFSLAIVTNNSVVVARKTLAVLGINQCFDHVIGLDTTGFSKPHEEPFLCAAREMQLPPEECISVGDRYDIDLAIPLSLGMGGILVKGTEDVYELPLILRKD
jgi:phosphoglycolate phosphatase/putative hydrolase of the HAD superfamily